jgi:hypothetical protein
MGPGRIRKRRVKPNGEGFEDRSASRRVNGKPPKTNMRLNRAAITDEMMNDLEQELILLWEDNMVGDYHQNIFQLYLKLLPRDSAAAMMAKEIDDLKKNKAPIQKVNIAIIARENVLTEVQQLENFDGENMDTFVIK